MMLHTKYQGSRPYGFRKEDFFMFFLIWALVKHVTPVAGCFWLEGYIFNKLGRGPLGDATKCQGSKPFGFRQKIFFNVFSLYNLM